MKILVLSDVHASLDGLQAVWQQEGGADTLLFLGDAVDWGFHPHETIGWLQEHGAVGILGNHDREMLASYDRGGPPVGSPYTFTHYTLPLLTEEDRAWLRALPVKRRLVLDGVAYYMEHCRDYEDPKAFEKALIDHRSRKWFEAVWAAEMGDMPKTAQRRILLGHSHQPMIHGVGGGAQVCNPGSLAYRKGADALAKGADYLVIESGEPHLRHVDYPVDHLTALVQTTPFCREVYEPALVYFSK